MRAPAAFLELQQRTDRDPTLVTINRDPPEQKPSTPRLASSHSHDRFFDSAMIAPRNQQVTRETAYDSRERLHDQAASSLSTNQEREKATTAVTVEEARHGWLGVAGALRGEEQREPPNPGSERRAHQRENGPRAGDADSSVFAEVLSGLLAPATLGEQDKSEVQGEASTESPLPQSQSQISTVDVHALLNQARARQMLDRMRQTEPSDYGGQTKVAVQRLRASSIQKFETADVGASANPLRSPPASSTRMATQVATTRILLSPTALARGSEEQCKPVTPPGGDGAAVRDWRPRAYAGAIVEATAAAPARQRDGRTDGRPSGRADQEGGDGAAGHGKAPLQAAARAHSAGEPSGGVSAHEARGRREALGGPGSAVRQSVRGVWGQLGREQRAWKQLDAVKRLNAMLERSGL